MIITDSKGHKMGEKEYGAFDNAYGKEFPEEYCIDKLKAKLNKWDAYGTYGKFPDKYGADKYGDKDVYSPYDYHETIAREQTLELDRLETEIKKLLTQADTRRADNEAEQNKLRQSITLGQNQIAELTATIELLKAKLAEAEQALDDQEEHYECELDAASNRIMELEEELENCA
jgi:hypothetical protein